MLYIILGQGVADLIPISILERIISEDVGLKGVLVSLIMFLVHRLYKNEEKIEKLITEHKEKIDEERLKLEKCKDDMREKELNFLREMIKGNKNGKNFDE